MAFNADGLNCSHGHFGLGRGKFVELMQALTCQLLASDNRPMGDHIVYDDQAPQTRQLDRPLEIGSEVRSIRIDKD